MYCGYSLESPRQGDSNELPQYMFLWRNKQNYPLIITKYAPYVAPCYCSVVLGVRGTLSSEGNIVIQVHNSFLGLIAYCLICK